MKFSILLPFSPGSCLCSCASKRKGGKGLGIVGEALLNKRPRPTLTPWLPSKPTLLQGIFFYQKTHMEELQLEKTKKAIRQVFIDACMYYSIRGWKVERVPS